MQEAFGWLVSLLQALAEQPAGRQALQACPASLKGMAGVCQLLARREEIEQRYIARLEGVQLLASVLVYTVHIELRLIACLEGVRLIN